MITYLILTTICIILFIIIANVTIKNNYNKLIRKKQEQKNEISYKECIEIPESEMKRELRKFNLSKKDWLSRKKHILMQKFSRRKNRK